MPQIQLDCKTLEALMVGGIHTGAPTLVFGIPNLGKTWLCYQAACACTRDPKYGGLGRPALYLDTEQFFRPDVHDRFYDMFKKKWTDLPPKEKIDMRRTENIFKLFEYFGMELVIKQEEARNTAIIHFPTERQKKLAETAVKKGAKDVEAVKGTFQAGNWLENSPLWKDFKEKNYGIMIIDSITIPIKSVLPSTTQNLPARTTVLTALLGTLYDIAIAFDCAIIVTDHITRNPIDPRSMGEPWGGANVMYYIKNQYGLFPPTKDLIDKYIPDGLRVRRVERHRMPGFDRELCTVMLGLNVGYIDLPGASPVKKA